MGIKDIDEQHAQLLACLDRLELWVGKGHGFPAALDALTTLGEYVAKHFQYEEDLLRARGYPKLDEHIAEHRQISADLAALLQQVLDGGDITEQLLAMLRLWITQHIGVEDREFAAFFGDWKG
jgi:hemerythrin-like metal-binding protein